MTQESIFLNLPQIQTMHSHLNSFKTLINSPNHKIQAINSNYTTIIQNKIIKLINY